MNDDLDSDELMDESQRVMPNGGGGGGSAGQARNSAAWSSDGLVLVWSLYRQKVPEFVFTCQSPVMTAKFDPFSTNLVVGATFSGQVVLWDKFNN